MTTTASAYDPELCTSMPKMTIGQFAELVEDDVCRTSVIRDDRLVMLPVARTVAEYERMCALALFLRRLEPHKRAVAELLAGKGTRR